MICNLISNAVLLFQERRITPGEALNHAFVTLAHLVDYAHCNNVKASVQMMEVCRRNGYNNSGSSSHHQAAQQAPPLVANFVPSSNGNVTLTFNNQLTNQVQRLVRERATTYDNLVRYFQAFYALYFHFLVVIFFIHCINFICQVFWLVKCIAIFPACVMV
jgi:homeodomain interacting protein kinase